MGKLEREFCHDDECTALARTIFGEARGEKWLGKVAVGHVILNRVADERWPNTVQGVVFQSAQFSCYGEGRHRPPIEKFPLNGRLRRGAAAECLRAASAVLTGRVDDPTDGANHYASIGLWRRWKRSGTMRKWAKIRTPKRIGGHVFLRDK